MPAFTVNRSYPYSVPGDPADVPEALQALAEAVNDDVDALVASVGPRPMARVRGTTPVIAQDAGPSFVELPFELIDFNVGGAIAPLTSGRVKVLHPGLWLAFSTVNYVSAAAPSNITYAGVTIRDQDSGGEVGTVSTHTVSFPGLVRTMDVGGSRLMQDPLTFATTLFLEGTVQRSSGTQPFTFRDRTLTLLRMTQS